MMRKLLFATLLSISLVQFGCSQPPPPQTTPPGEEKPGPEEPLDPPGPENPGGPSLVAECRKNPAYSERCACVLNASGDECFCKKEANKSSEKCQCLADPNLPICSCLTNEKSLECFCARNPTSRNCQSSIADRCNNYCLKLSDEQRLDKEEKLTKELLNEDCDHDGLTNKEEIDNLTQYLEETRRGDLPTHKYYDPCKEDSNGNGIIDSKDHTGYAPAYEAEEKDSKKCGKIKITTDDTDGDGVPDVREKELDLKPNDCRTPFKGVFGYTDRDNRSPEDRYGAKDKDLWIINACKEKEEALKSIQLRKLISQETADIQMLLPQDTVGTVYKPSEGATRDVAMLFSTPAQGIFGGLLAQGVEPGSGESPTTSLDHIKDSINPVSYTIGSEKVTHDNFKFAQAEMIVNVTQEHTQEFFFKKILGSQAAATLKKFPNPTDPTDPPGLKNDLENNTSGSTGEYSLKVTVIYRTHRNERGDRIEKPSEEEEEPKRNWRDVPETWDQVIYLYAFAPVRKTPSNTGSGVSVYSVGSDLTETRMQDLTNTTSISQLANKPKPVCTEMRGKSPNQLVYFYFVLDESGSMDKKNEALMEITKTFFAKVANTELDFRVGVTNLSSDPSNLKGHWYKGTQGDTPPRLGTVARWLGEDEDGAAKFEADVYGIKMAGGGNEVGFRAAKEGIKAMKNSTDPKRKIEPNSKVITIWMSDEEDHGYFPDNQTPAFLNGEINEFKTLGTTAFALVSDPRKTGTENSGYSYVQVALGTGGGYGKLTINKEDYLSTLDAIIDAARSETSKNELPETPISSTLQVYKDGSRGGTDPKDPQNPPLVQEAIFVPRSEESGFTYTPENDIVSFTGKYRFPRYSSTTERGEDFIVIYYFYDHQTKKF